MTRAPVDSEELLRLARKAWPDKHILLSRGEVRTYIVDRLENGYDLPVMTADNDRVHAALLVLAGELDVAALLAERDRLRAELAGAKERGRKLERAAVVRAMREGAEGCAPTSWGRFAANALREIAGGFERGDHVRTGTTPPDAGDSGP